MAEDIMVIERQLVLFTLANEIYGVDISAVHEIIRMQPITKVPKAPFFVEGIINLRGKVIPVVDMRRRFNMISTEQTKDSRIVVVDVQGTTIGMIVDSVTEVLRIPADSVEPPSDIVTASDSDYLQGIAKLDDMMVILLDMDQALSGEVIKAMSSEISTGVNDHKKEEKEKAVEETEALAVASS